MAKKRLLSARMYTFIKQRIIHCIMEIVDRARRALTLAEIRQRMIRRGSVWAKYRPQAVDSVVCELIRKRKLCWVRA